VSGPPDTAGDEGDLVVRLAGFGELLRDAGLRTGPDRTIDGVAALGCVDIGDLDQMRDALRAVYVCRREEVAVFDAAFDIYWSRPDAAIRAGAIPQRSRPLPLDPEKARSWLARLGLPESEIPRELSTTPTVASSSGYSADELLRERDFGDLTWEETQQMRRLLRQAPWRLAERRTRRWQPGRHGRIELRRTMRRAARTGGDAVIPARARRRIRRRPLVIICDVSGSMERYSRALLVFAHAIARRERVDTFVFSTRLSRITHLLRRRDIDEALADTAEQVHDIGGGTRIGESLRTFNRRYARRVLGHGAVVLIISDGWDRGEVEVLDREMARLARSCHRLIWLNPLLGSDVYAPEARGMATALPHCDDFLAAHNVDALDELGRRLAELPRRSARR
jgi:uncharacterized protein with von Willebrand factor type A (vWA) domain